MFKENIVVLLIGAVLLFALPAKALAQTIAQREAAGGGQTSSSRLMKQEPNLKAALDKEISNIKTRTLTTADYQQIEKDRQDQQSQQAAKKGWTKKEKIGLAVFVGIMVAVTVGFIIRGINTTPICADDPFVPDCI